MRLHLQICFLFMNLDGINVSILKQKAGNNFIHSKNNSMSHTHEVRKFDYRKPKGKQTTVEHKGNSNEECYQWLEALAKESNCGAGLLLNNGGYSIVDLAEEKKNYIKSLAPELLDALIDLYNASGRGNKAQIERSREKAFKLVEKTKANKVN
jgi:hypothetical protein